MYAVEIENYSWKYEGSKFWALDGINLKVKRGEFIGIIGPSGAGKSTLCLSLNGLIPFRVRGVLKGHVKIFGKPTIESSIYELSKKVGMVFQDPETQFVTMSVKDEIVFGMENFGVSPDEMRKRLDWSLKTVRLEGTLEKAPTELSGGQKQRVAIASILVLYPEIFVLDEPTSDLDPIGKAEVFETIAKIREEFNATMIVVEHEIEQISKYADRLILMNEGKILLDAPTDEFFEQLELIENVGESAPQVTELFYKMRKKGKYSGKLPLTLEEAYDTAKKVLPKRKVDVPEIIEDNVQSENESKNIVIKTINLTHVYPDGTVAIKDINLEVYRGDFIAIIGQNGSGKTTLVKHFNGLLYPTSGKVLIEGVDTTSKEIKNLFSKVGYVFQNPDHQLFCHTVWEEVTFAPKNMGLPEDEVERRGKEALELVGLTRLADEHPFFLGKGQRQRLAVASVLSMKPEILIVDEPMTGQDWKQAFALMELFKKINEKENVTVIIITHNMRLVAEYTKRVIIMAQGRKLYDGPTRKAFLNEDVLSEAFLRPPMITEFGMLLHDEYGIPKNVLSVDEMMKYIEMLYSE
ncbi:MAG: ATP-binding cassette domain-containing protein [Candidatus Odinarchaeota archaeon]|nr:ATP-binding cassette domain-containing protein [Candidatus Odinarchaeota archaeon]